MDFKQGLGLCVAQAFDIHKSGIEKVARRRRDHGQRVARRRARRLPVGHMVGQAVQALVCQALAEKFAAPAGRGKAALGIGRLGHLQAGKAVFQQGLEVHVRAKGRAAQGFVVIGKAGFGKAHARGQLAKYVCVAAGLAHGGNGWAVEQHVGVAVAAVDVPVLELRGRGQHVVGVVGGVG